MRQPFAAVILAGSAFLLTAAAAADRPYQRNGKPPQYSDSRGQYYTSPRADQVCQERARAEDPTGLYAGFPCWAREAFGRGSQGGRVSR